MGYRKALDSIWRPKLGPLPFLQVRYSTLSKIASQYKTWSKKSYNNKIGVLRRAFEFGYRDHPGHSNPAWSLKGARIRRRPSEEIALKERDFDEVRGTLAVTKARVYGVDKDTTKTHEDRVIQLCPRAIAVLTRQRALHRHLKSRGRMDHDQLFFRHDGAPIRDLGYLAKCWRKAQSDWARGSGAPIAPGTPPSAGIS
jgi:integrase